MPRKKTIDKVSRKINDNFRELLAAAFIKGFKPVEIETNFNLFSGRLVSTRKDGNDLTPEQMAFIGAYSAGYSDAMIQVHD